MRQDSRNCLRKWAMCAPRNLKVRLTSAQSCPTRGWHCAGSASQRQGKRQLEQCMLATDCLRRCALQHVPCCVRAKTERHQQGSYVCAILLAVSLSQDQGTLAPLPRTLSKGCTPGCRGCTPGCPAGHQLAAHCSAHNRAHHEAQVLGVHLGVGPLHLRHRHPPVLRLKLLQRVVVSVRDR